MVLSLQDCEEFSIDLPSSPGIEETYLKHLVAEQSDSDHTESGTESQSDELASDDSYYEETDER